MHDDAVVELLGNDAVDLTNCDREPIHRPGAIQPAGVLIGHDGEIVTHLADPVGATGLHPGQAVESLPAGLLGGSGDRRLDVFGATHDVATHVVGPIAVIELEAVDTSIGDDLLAARAAELSREIDVATTLAEARDLTCRAVRDLTGFDRVMVYQFHDDDHGEVVAEARDDDLEPYLGLHYPATDIPRQARALYLQSPIRQIFDVAADPAPIARAPGAPDLHLGDAQLRAVSPIHRDYLANMGVGASLSISLIVERRLVGLIACHHRTPRHIGLPMRRICELLARLLSDRFARLAELETRRLEEFRLATQFVFLRELVLAPDREHLIDRVLDVLPALVDASGFQARTGDLTVRRGEGPDEAELDAAVSSCSGPSRRPSSCRPAGSRATRVACWPSGCPMATAAGTGVRR